MSSSDFTCKCGQKLGEVKNGVLRYERNVAVRNFLRAGYAQLKCPKCGQARTFRGGVVMLRASGSD